MKLLNGNRNLKIVALENSGGYLRDLTTVIPTYSATRRTIRELMKMGWKFDNLGIVDIETGRLISWIQ